jgi:hypothetical protein
MKIQKRTILKIDECFDECIESKILTKDETKKIINYMGEGNDGNYWTICWGDIEEENGMEHEEAQAFRRFYEKYKEYEEKEGQYRSLLFDCTVYS